MKRERRAAPSRRMRRMRTLTRPPLVQLSRMERPTTRRSLRTRTTVPRPSKSGPTAMRCAVYSPLFISYADP